MLLNSRNPKLKHPGSKKLLPHWVGLFIVEHCIGPIAYSLELLHSIYTVHLYNTPVFHMPKLMRYRTDGQCQPPLPLIELEGELKYEVEKILNKRIWKVGRRSRIEYLIHWHGYDHAHDSQKPIRNLKHCQESIQANEDFHRLLPNTRRCGTIRRR